MRKFLAEVAKVALAAAAESFAANAGAHLADRWLGKPEEPAKDAEPKS